MPLKSAVGRLSGRTRAEPGFSAFTSAYRLWIESGSDEAYFRAFAGSQGHSIPTDASLAVGMILGVGTDLAEVDRIRQSMARFGDRFLHRIYTERERRYASSKANSHERFAARFAAKEAGMKAIGTGWSRGVSWLDFEVINEPSGRPTLRLVGAAEDIAARLGTRRISLSLTHTAQLAMAVVILEDGN